MIVRFSPRAIADLEEIADCIRSRNPRAAQRIRDTIVDSIDILTQSPHAGRRQNVENVRRLAIRRYPYLVYYRPDVAAGEIVIVTIQHAARRRSYSDV